jgi:hypothetical protein
MRRLGFGIGVLLAAVWTCRFRRRATTGTSGRVTIPLRAAAAPGVTVVVGSRSAVTASNGATPITGVPAGTDTLKTGAIGYAPFPAVTMVAGETLELDLA